MKKKFLLSLISFCLLVGVVSIVGPMNHRVTAMDMSGFQAGNIIDNATFYDSDSLSTTQIQSFLNAKVPTCDTQGSLMYTSTQTVKQYWTPRGEPAPYTCLKDYSQKTPYMNGESGICSQIPANPSQAAAQIITTVSAACGISPKVMLVLLQKEQFLVTDTSPLRHHQYEHATGFGCPDTAPCDPDYGGFFYQVYYAARQFRLYAANPTEYNYVAGQSNKIAYSPDSSCGSSWVYIQNQATAGLYDYTPYQPNAATLKAGLGATVKCGAYGNKNFWWYFTDWFGSTKSSSYTEPSVPAPNFNFSRLAGPAPAKTPSTGDLGEYSSVVYTGSTLHVFFYDSAQGVLQHSWYSSGGWQTEDLDGNSTENGKTKDDVGMYVNSIYNKVTKTIEVFYYNKTKHSLKYASYSETSQEWSFETLEGSDGISKTSADVGMGVSGVVYTTGTSHIYYYDKTNGNLRHAWYKDEKWKFETLDGSAAAKSKYSGIDTGLTPSAIVNNGTSHIYYYDKTNGNLRHAWFKNGVWKFETVNGSKTSKIGESSDIGLQAKSIYLKGNAYVFYYSPTTMSWSFSTYNGDDGWNDYDLDGSSMALSGSSSAVGGTLSLDYYDNGESIQIFYRDSVNKSLVQAYTKG